MKQNVDLFREQIPHNMTSSDSTKPTTTSKKPSPQLTKDILGAPEPSSPTESLSHILYDPTHPTPPPYQNKLFKGSQQEFMAALQQEQTRTVYFGKLAHTVNELQIWDLAWRSGYSCEKVILSRDRITQMPFYGGKQYAFAEMTARCGAAPLVQYACCSTAKSGENADCFVSHLDIVEPRRKMYAGWDLGYAPGLQYGPPGVGGGRRRPPPRAFHGAPPPYGAGVPRGSLGMYRGEKRYRDDNSAQFEQRKRRRTE